VETQKSTFGLDKNVVMAACYLVGWLTGIVFFLSEKEDPDIRFNAMQAIVFFGALNILAIVPLIGWILSPFIMLVALVSWIVLLVKSYQGETLKLPVVGAWAQKLTKKFS